MIQEARSCLRKAFHSKKLRGRDESCPYYPCHFHGQDCTWCFCPFYPCYDASLGGKTIYVEDGRKAVWSCKNCTLVHNPNVAQQILDMLKKESKGKLPSKKTLHTVFKKIKQSQRSKRGKALMIQGTSSHSGKTLITAALCRILSTLGYTVAPFKAQNMSLNSYVTSEGEEISRSQALQALASRREPATEMNPVLIKPKGENTSQIVLHGTPFKDLTVEEYYRTFALNEGLNAVLESLERLLAQNDFILIEGAGSPAEINLKPFEIANMRVAELANAHVLLVGDIDRGGVFASLVGTLRLLTKKQRNRIKGFIINKFRGDINLLSPAIKKVEEITGKPVLGVIPFIEPLQLPAEDALSIEDYSKSQMRVNISVVRLPGISNFTDFEPLQRAGLGVRYIDTVESLTASDAVIIPGTKNTIRSLLWMKEQGIAEKIRHLSTKRIPIIGICGGFQILGKRILDPRGLEGGVEGEFEGLDLLDITTIFKEYTKVTKKVSAEVVGDGPILSKAKGTIIDGYEIHMGGTEYGEQAQPIFKVFNNMGEGEVYDGAVSKNGLVLGTYLHGVFDQAPLRVSLTEYLESAKNIQRDPVSPEDTWGVWDRDLNLLAQTVEANLNMKYIFHLLKIRPKKRE
ncbi:cobyric acid synthase [[Eubacterium] cellulosolvens]